MSLVDIHKPNQSEVATTPVLVEELTRRMVTADEGAYRQFFELYARRLFIYLLALTNGNEAAAKELLQQSMIRVAKYIRGFESEEILWSWLKGIARSCWIDEHRKHARYGSILELFRREKAGQLARASDVPESLADEMFATLHPDERQMLEEKYLEGWSVREMAEARDLTEKAVESRLGRIRHRLKAILTHERFPEK